MRISDWSSDVCSSDLSVLAVTGPQQYEQVMRAVHDAAPPDTRHDPYIDLVPPQGIKLTPRHYAYLKLSEGCNHRCSFCIIPSMRGNLVSSPIGDVMGEAQRLVNAGVKERPEVRRVGKECVSTGRSRGSAYH